MPPEPSLQPSVAEVVAVATTGADSPTPGERVPPGTPPAPAGAGVRLGFADGAHVELAPDDPRLAGFRAAAQALLDGRGP
ncbi:MAG: hypothetical protein GC157_06710 [Frankiales bacterium]|nr:hypothetical protein [Frankiales bacterium]